MVLGFHVVFLQGREELFATSRACQERPVRSFERERGRDVADALGY